ncbi:T-box transcription factor TBX19-like isoform X2 [Festucalex cinctus]
MKVEERKDDGETSSRLLSAVENELEAGREKGDPTERGLRVTLEDGELWRKFQRITNEMIVTKNGRRMFPVLKVSVSGLDPSSMYSFLLDFIPADGCRWKFVSGEWLAAGRAEGRGHGGVYIHPDSPNFGAHWMKAAVTFNKVKLTNKHNAEGRILLNSLRKYQPHLHIVRVGSQHQLLFDVSFSETQFVAVTAYQNEEVTALKIKHNPFAKAFLDTKDKNPGRRGLAEPPQGPVGIPPSWSVYSPARGGGAFPYGGSLSLPSHHQHGCRHRGYAGRHSPYCYLPHRSPHSGVQVFSDEWSSTSSLPPTNNFPTTSSHSSSQYPCLWTVGCAEMSPSPSPCAILQEPITSEYLMQPRSTTQAGGAQWASGPAQSL